MRLSTDQTDRRNAEPRVGSIAAAAIDRASALRGTTDDELRRRAAALSGGQTPDSNRLTEVCALVCESSRRAIGQTPLPEQILAGLHLIQGRIVQMATGEGKTLTATIPLTWHALAGQGAHLLTANDYLARRDAQWMGPIFEQLGLTVGVVDEAADEGSRRAAYAADVTYTTTREVGFDWLRDRLRFRGRISGASTQQRCWFGLVDEADHGMIDEARTPMVISGPAQQSSGFAQMLAEWSARLVPKLHPVDIEEQRPPRRIGLTARGRRVVRCAEKPAALATATLPELYAAVETALLAASRFHRDDSYLVANDEVVLVDEFTGRIGDGKRWRGGLQQAVEAREGVDLTVPASPLAQLSVPELFKLYEVVSGMTATAMPAAAEFRRVYGLTCRVVPTHRPVRRVTMPPHVAQTTEDRWKAVVDEIRSVRAAGRPVLVGTRSVEKSLRLSQMLDDADIPHQLLNAQTVEDEARRIAGAGEPGQVTVSTNLAGRGTDIRLPEESIAAGGLHVVGTERHDSARIDAQLVGRAGRQGDPGSSRWIVSLDDELLSQWLGRNAIRKLRRLTARWNDRRRRRLWSLFSYAQRHTEKRHARQRRILELATTRRRERLEGLGLDPFLDLIDDV